jgi:hypothetical protein
MVLRTRCAVNVEGDKSSVVGVGVTDAVFVVVMSDVAAETT